MLASKLGHKKIACAFRGTGSCLQSYHHHHTAPLTSVLSQLHSTQYLLLMRTSCSLCCCQRRFTLWMFIKKELFDKKIIQGCASRRVCKKILRGQQKNPHDSSITWLTLTYKHSVDFFSSPKNTTVSKLYSKPPWLCYPSFFVIFWTWSATWKRAQQS